ncbi:MAG: HEAT repeat domain-containing protein [Rhodothermales bacterium]
MTTQEKGINPATGVVKCLILIIGMTFCFTAVAKAQSAAQSEGSPLATLPGRPAAHWDQLSKGLIDAIGSDHDGAKQGALRMIIFYGDQLDVSAAVFDVVRIYRDHEDNRLRRMAVVALGKMKSPWAIDFLERSVRFEKTPSVRQTIQAVVAAYHAPEDESPAIKPRIAEQQF